MHISTVDLAPGQFIMKKKFLGMNDFADFTMKLSKPFKMSSCVITQGQWSQMMNTAPWKQPSLGPSHWLREGDNYPAVGVSYDDAVEFCERLSHATARIFRLPTEVQWEYGYRAGTATKYYWGDSDEEANQYAWISNYKTRSSAHLHEVGLLKPNDWGLYDMAGLVFEWVRDRFDIMKNGPYMPSAHYPKSGIDFISAKGTSCMVRSGSFDMDLSVSEAGDWALSDPDYRFGNVGFRVVEEAQ